MDLLGVGPLELVFILLIIFLILGPDDLVATGRKLGRFLNTVRKSEFWQGVSQITKEVRTLPNTLMREAQLEDTKKELEKDINDVRQVGKEFDIKETRELEKDLKDELSVDLDEPAKSTKSAKPTEPVEPTIAPPEIVQPEAADQPETSTEEEKD
jgi:sec-independent protein translocase protein TatB